MADVVPDEEPKMLSASERRADLLHSSDVIAQKAMEILQDDADDWKDYADKGCEELGIKITYRQSEEFGGCVYRMEFVVDRPIEDILPLTTIIPPCHQLRHLWNPGFQESELLEQLDAETYLLHVTFQPLLGGIVQARDFCCVERIKCIVSEGSVYTITGSVEHPACAPTNGKVRADYHPSMWFMKPVDSTPEKTTVTRISQWDPKLTMMPWFVQNNHSLKWYAGRCIDFKKTAESLPPEDLKKMTKDVGFYDHVVKQLETPM